MSNKRTYTDEFKKQIVSLYKNGKTTASLVKEYGISAAAVYKWVKENDTTGSFKAADNRTPEENEMISLKKPTITAINSKVVKKYSNLLILLFIIHLKPITFIYII